MAAVTSTTAKRDAILARAKSQLGVHEIPAYSNITPYTRWYGITGPWCAMFVSWVFYHAGLALPISTSKGFAYCPYGVDWFKKRGAWATAAARPKPGWLVFFDFPGDGVNRVSHVGIVEGVAADGRIITIEGNTNAAGSRTGGNVMRHYRRSGIVGYGIINYVAPAKPTPPKHVHTNLRRGSKGPEVVELQRKLNAVTGSKLVTDGDFGPATEKVVLAFKKFFKLIPATSKDSAVGPNTWGLLDYVYALKTKK